MSMRQFQLGRVILLVLIFICSCDNSGLGPIAGFVEPAQLRQRIREVLFEASHDADPLIRCHALESFAIMGKPYAGEFIRNGFHDSEAVVRFAAAVAAGDIRDLTARTYLETLLRDDSPSVRLGAGYALEQMGDSRFIQWYDQILLGDNSQLAAQACMLLGKLGQTPARTDSREKLRQVLYKKDQAISVKLQAVEALARLGDKTIIKKLLVYASSGYADDRMIAISGLEQIRNTDTYAMLTALIDDPQIEVRLAAAGALGPMVEPADLDLVREQMTFSHPEGDELAMDRVRGLAAMALGKIGTKQDSGLLYQALNSPKIYVRLAGARGALDYLKRYDH